MEPDKSSILGRNKSAAFFDPNHIFLCAGYLTDKLLFALAARLMRELEAVTSLDRDGNPLSSRPELRQFLFHLVGILHDLNTSPV